MDKDKELLFPAAGVNVGCEYERQPKATTPSASNARAYDALAARLRGGSRPGLVKYPAQQVPAGAHLVQHLNFVVDPTTPALLANAETGGTVEDPRYPGRFVPAGGSAVQQNANVNPSSGGTAADIQFVQRVRTQGVFSAATTLTLPNRPTVGNHILVVVRTETPGGSPELPDSVRSGGLVDFAEAGTGGSPESEVTFDIGNGESTEALTVWWKRVADSADQQVVVAPGGSGAIYEVMVLEYRGANSAAPVSNTVEASDASGASPFTLPDLALNGTTGQLVLAAYSAINTGAAALSSGFTARFGATNLVPSSEPANTLVLEAGSLAGVGPSRPTVTPTSARPYCAIAVALKR